MIGERMRGPGESDESWAAHRSMVATLSLRAILATPEGRQALKALLTEDAPARAIVEATHEGPCLPEDLWLGRNAAGAAVDALDSPKGER